MREQQIISTKENQFSIKANTYTLKKNKEDNIILTDDAKYIIPIYQRPYSWTEEQITKFISDIFKSFYGYDKQSKPEPMFVGTMQLSGKTKKVGDQIEQEVIDGQQRLTTFLLLLKQLKHLFPNQNELQNIRFNWLETKVNSGEQQKYLTAFLETNSNYVLNDEIHNPYLKNALIIQTRLSEEFLDNTGKRIVFEIDSFINHLYSNIYFVVIETLAGLSKTLQIFDAINTTGLDLNGSDVFKIRMFEYLKDKENQKDEVFGEINELYAKVDRYNKDFSYNISFSEILGIYQDILISKYDLSKTLYSLGTDTFFERLFDVIFNITIWKDFNNNANNVKLNLEDIDKIIEARFLWEKLSYPTFEDACSTYFIWWSRYRRFWTIIIVFIYKFNRTNEDLFKFINRLSKLYFLYSIYFDKSIGNIYTFTYELIDKIVYGAEIDNIIKSIEDKISSHVPYHDIEGKIVFKNKLNENIAYNAKKKNLICRLSAMLDENYMLDCNFDDLIERFFNSDDFPNDIEHIQSFNDEDLKIRDDIKLEWGHNLHSIGNLILLERDINRSISNKVYFEKCKDYGKSKFKTIHKQVKTYNEWALKDCHERKINEIKKLSNYLFENNTSN